MECAKHKGVEVTPIFKGVGWSRQIIGYDCPECKKEETAGGNQADFSSRNGWGSRG